MRKSEKISSPVAVESTVTVPIWIRGDVIDEMDVFAPNEARYGVDRCLVESVFSFNGVPCCTLAVVDA